MISNILNLFCGIGLFLLGINLMGEYTEKACGDKLRHILSKLTKNKLTGVLTGALVTGILQSSCAVTVMTVSFINSGIMTLKSAVGIIMGANIGTTVTSLLIAINFSFIAPVVIFVGTMLKLFSKKISRKELGMVIIGFGLLFVGMNTMSASMSFLENNSFILNLLTGSGNHFLLIFSGFAVTAIMQSSSATVGILQSLAMQGLIGTGNAVYILFGQNIGAVIPTLVSSIGGKTDAKRAAVIHLLFNLFGTAFFLVLCRLIPYVEILEKVSSMTMRISLSHIVFNVISTIVLLPFSNVLIKLSEKIIVHKFKHII